MPRFLKFKNLYSKDFDDHLLKKCHCANVCLCASTPRLGISTYILLQKNIFTWKTFMQWPLNFKYRTSCWGTLMLTNHQHCSDWYGLIYLLWQLSHLKCWCWTSYTLNEISSFAGVSYDTANRHVNCGIVCVLVPDVYDTVCNEV